MLLRTSDFSDLFITLKYLPPYLIAEICERANLRIAPLRSKIRDLKLENYRLREELDHAVRAARRATSNAKAHGPIRRMSPVYDVPLDDDEAEMISSVPRLNGEL